MSVSSIRPESQKDSSIELIKNQSDIKKVRKIANDWLEEMSERMGQSRLKKNAGEEGSMENFLKDQVTFSNYKDVIGYIKKGLTSLEKDLKSSHQHSFHYVYVLYDKNRTLQGISVAEQSDHNTLYLHGLISAAWNIQMEAPSPHSDKVLKGVGKALLQANIQLCQKRHLQELETTPSMPALSFYQHIGMRLDEAAMVYTLRIPASKSPPTSPAKTSPKRILGEASPQRSPKKYHADKDADNV